MAKFTTNASNAIWWPNLQPMQVAPSGGQIYSQCKKRHLVAEFMTNANSAIQIKLRHLGLTEINLERFWLKYISQVMDSISWVRCASGNVWSLLSALQLPVVPAGNDTAAAGP